MPTKKRAKPIPQASNCFQKTEGATELTMSILIKNKTRILIRTGSQKFFDIKRSLVYLLALSFVVTAFLNFYSFDQMKSVGLGPVRDKVVCHGESCFYDDFVDVYSIGLKQFASAGDSSGVEIIRADFKKKFNKLISGLILPNEQLKKCFKTSVRSSFWIIKSRYSPEEYLKRENEYDCFMDQVLNFSD